jgi:hypothetical protein
MLGCTTNINEQLCVCSMESPYVTPCSTVFTVVTRCTLLLVGVCRSTAGSSCCLYPCML